ncbi:MAG: hypothetical protein KF708_03915 [Pirellulales bacterium]|nr:hypothetical protein [Pirellulales bacterium]
MAWLDTILDTLARRPVCGYVVGGEPFSEPTALAALALVAQERIASARPALDWLAELQTSEGMLGLNHDEPWPHWPTSLALLAWLAAGDDVRYGQSIRRAAAWLLTIEGQPVPESDAIGHDVTLVGWPWVETTHSWMEPTAWTVLALRAAGSADHPRVREGTRLLVDRLLPSGGANYGNTYVLHQELRPQVAPTGVTMMALAQLPAADARVNASLDYLTHTLGPHEAAISLAWGLLGLAAFRRVPEAAGTWLRMSAVRTLSGGREPIRLAALALAAPLQESPLIRLLERTEAAT